MKPQCQISVLFVSGLLLVFPVIPAYANEFSLKAGAGMVLLNRADNLWGSGKKSIGSIYEKPKEMTKVAPFPIIDARYIDNVSTAEYYLGTSSDEPGALLAGIDKDFDNSSSIGFYGFYSFSEKVWQNPYALNRETTDMKEYGGKAALEYMNITLSYRLAFADVRTDLIGDMYNDLKRDGTTHTIGINYQQMLSEKYALTPGLYWEKGSFKGKSNNYDSYELSLGFDRLTPDFVLNTKVSAKNGQFDKSDPVFHKTRDEKTYAASVIAVFPKLFGSGKYFATAGAVASKTDSNIIFFDRHGITAFAGAGCKF